MAATLGVVDSMSNVPSLTVPPGPKLQRVALPRVTQQSRVAQA